MVIGALQIELDIPGAMCLKDKRRVVRSIKDSCHRHHMVSVAEISALDVWNRSVLGVSVVSNSGMIAGRTLDRVIDRIRSVHDCEIISMSREILRCDVLVERDEVIDESGELETELLAYAEDAS